MILPGDADNSDAGDGGTPGNSVGGSCPNCGTDLIGEWLKYEVRWIGDDVDASMECPECGWDMLKNVSPADALDVIEEGRGDG